MKDPTQNTRLAAWIALHGMSQAEASELIGMSKGHLSRIMNGLVPSVLTRKAIELATQGAVKAEEWE